VTLLTFPFGQDVDHPGLEIVRCPRAPLVSRVGIGFSAAKLAMDAMLTLTMVRLLRERSFDVIHAVEEAVFPAVWLRGRSGARVVYDMDSRLVEQLLAKGGWRAWLRKPLEAIERHAVTRSDAVVPVCESLADYAREHRPDHEVFLLPDVPEPRDEQQPAEEQLTDLVGDRPIALYVGNLERYQGMDLLLEAGRKLPERADVAIVIVGGGDALPHYRRRVEELGLQQRCYFVGPRPLAQLDAYLRQADLLLSPRLEGGNTPMKIYAYMMAERPIVATHLDTHTQVLDERSAVLLPPEPAAFAEAMHRLSLDSRAGRSMAARARARVERDYSMDRFRERTAHLYAHLQRTTAAADG
jgi:glycosyltransferase involved in cell wall biosynthesis